jgi:hypothetical protein
MFAGDRVKYIGVSTASSVSSRSAWSSHNAVATSAATSAAAAATNPANNAAALSETNPESSGPSSKRTENVNTHLNVRGPQYGASGSILLFSFITSLFLSIYLN